MHKPNPIVPKLGHDPHSFPQPGTPIPDWITLHPKITHFDFGPQNQGEHGAEITGLGPIGGRR